MKNELPVATGNARARQLWDAWEFGKRRGHGEYVEQARLCEDFVLGAGLQWSEEERYELERKGKLPVEINLILGMVQSAIGYQINNRAQIQLRPRGRGADEQKAEILQKVVHQIADNCRLHQRETLVFSDGCIQQRGFLDISLAFGDSVYGEIDIQVLDPMDVIPDPDAKDSDPDNWRRVQIGRYYTADEVQQKWGEEVARKLLGLPVTEDDDDFGDQGDSFDVPRAKFGMNTRYAQGMDDGTRPRRWQIIETQEWEWKTAATVAIWPETGDVRVVEHLTPAKRAELATSGAIITKRPQRVVRQTLSTRDHELESAIIPFPFFTIVPFFWLFRRGRTRGLVDNAISPQQVSNKALSQFIHILATAAGSGWITDQGSLTNMTARDLEERGGEAGLHIEVKAGARVPTQITPPPAPEGLRELMSSMPSLMQQVTGINAAMQGVTEGQESGIALQSRQFAAQQQLAMPLDNLSTTRMLLARRILWLVQNYYDYPRIWRITETDLQGNVKTVELPTNIEQPDGSVLNDLTIGEYDIVIDSVPASVTFENGQFQQLLEMRKLGVRVPDAVLVQASNAARKAEVIKAMNEAAPDSNPLDEAKALAMQAKAALDQAAAINKRVEGLYSAITAAQLVATTPGVAPVADQILHSAGFKDSDAAPIVAAPTGMAPAALAPPQNTNPLTPPNPGVGANAGMETGQ